MKSENKNILLYIGGAITIGAIGFFVYSFFAKPIVVADNLSLSLREEDPSSTSEEVEETPSIFSSLKETVFAPIKIPKVF